MCVLIRVRGRRAVAVLREASRQNRLIYSHRLVETLEGSRQSRESTFVQREEGCGENLGYARLASRHHCSSVELALASLSWSGAQERAEPWQAPTLPPLADVYR